MNYCYKIVLDNFFEARSASWQEEPISDSLSTPAQGMAPHPWELVFSSHPFFEDRVEYQHVPFTDVIKPCPQCIGIFFFSLLIFRERPIHLQPVQGTWLVTLPFL